MSRVTNNLIIFLVPPFNIVSGGILSIFSICKESRNFHDIHKSEVVLCTYPGTQSYGKNTNFENNEIVLDFGKVLREHKNLDSLILHIPEYSIGEVYNGLQQYTSEIEKISDLHINILNQNIKLMPPESVVADLYNLTTDITQTIAHKSYATQSIADKYSINSHLLSVYLDKNQYTKVKPADKQKIISVSSDEHPDKVKFLQKIAVELPEYKIIEIKGMPYEKYKETIAKSRYIITFGEGFDGYLIEGVFSGGISFAVYDPAFFPSKEYLKFPNIYQDYDEMFRKICVDMKKFESNDLYNKINEKNLTALNQIYNYQNYLNNIKNFYIKNYSFTPKEDSVPEFFLRAINQKSIEIQKLSVEIHQRDVEIQKLINSHSWKVTKPLRKISSLVNNKKS